jgi:hypothetical protein
LLLNGGQQLHDLVGTLAARLVHPTPRENIRHRDTTLPYLSYGADPGEFRGKMRCPPKRGVFFRQPGIPLRKRPSAGEFRLPVRRPRPMPPAGNGNLIPHGFPTTCYPRWRSRSRAAGKSGKTVSSRLGAAKRTNLDTLESPATLRGTVSLGHSRKRTVAGMSENCGTERRRIAKATCAQQQTLSRQQRRPLDRDVQIEWACNLAK